MRRTVLSCSRAAHGTADEKLDTLTVSGLEVRTHAKEEVELFPLARGDGMTARDAAAFAGVGMGAAKRWSAGRLPRSYAGGNRGRRRPSDPRGSPGGEDRDQGAARAARDGPARRDDSRPDRGAAAQGGVGRPKRGGLAPPFDPDAEQVRARQGIEGGHRSADVDDRPFPRHPQGHLLLPPRPRGARPRRARPRGGPQRLREVRPARLPRRVGAASPRRGPRLGGGRAPRGARARAVAQGRPRTRRCARTAPATSAPRPPTSCGSPTSRSPGCPAGRSAACRPSSAASTAGRRPGRSGRAPRRGSPAPRSRRRARPWRLERGAGRPRRPRRPPPPAGPDRDLRARRADPQHVAQGHEPRQRPGRGSLRPAQAGALLRRRLGGGLPRRLHAGAGRMDAPVPRGPHLPGARPAYPRRAPGRDGVRGVRLSKKMSAVPYLNAAQQFAPRGDGGPSCGIVAGGRANCPLSDMPPIKACEGSECDGRHPAPRAAPCGNAPVLFEKHGFRDS